MLINLCRLKSPIHGVCLFLYPNCREFIAQKWFSIFQTRISSSVPEDSRDFHLSLWRCLSSIILRETSNAKKGAIRANDDSSCNHEFVVSDSIGGNICH
jgi:hypothetical protein